MSGPGSMVKVGAAFGAVNKPKAKRRKRTPPVSIRFSDDERAWLEGQAGGTPVSRYVKDAVLSSRAVKRKPRRRAPVKDHTALAQVLGLLGRSETGRMLGGILFALEMGQLELDDAAEADLRQACADVSAMREALMAALDMPEERGR
jgi:hypothetical protein